MVMKVMVRLIILIVFFVVDFQSFAQVKIVGYVPNWVNLTTFSSSFDYSRVTHLNIAFKNPNDNGDLPNLTVGEQSLVNAAHQNGVKVLVSIAGGAASENATIRNRYFTLINSTNRSNFCSKLKNYTVNNNLDGMDVDLEGPAINSNYGIFIQQLGDSLHSANKLMTSALSEGYGGGAVPVSTFAYFDWINIMAYDATGTWAGSPVGQHSSYQLAEAALIYWKGRGLPKEKAILGVPFYGYGFINLNGYQSYSSIITNYPDNIYDDEAGNIVYYNGINTIQDKTSLAVSEGGGIMIWELSQDATGNSSLLKAIKETVDLTSVSNASWASNFAISPNPSSGIISITGLSTEVVSLTLFNAVGEQIIVTAEGNTLDLTNQAKGIYYLHISTENNHTTKKLIVY